MPTETDNPETGATPAVSGEVTNPAAAPGVIAGIGSIAAAVIGFGIPVLGIFVACAGIWPGVVAVRRGRKANYNPSVILGIIGISIALACIVFWVCAVLFESYH